MSAVAVPRVFLSCRPAALEPIAVALRAELAARKVDLVDPAIGAEDDIEARLDALADCELIVVLVGDTAFPAVGGRSLAELELAEARRTGIDPLVIRLADDAELDPSAFAVLDRVAPCRVISAPDPTALRLPVTELVPALAGEICVTVLSDPCPPDALAGVESPGAARASIQRLLDDIDELGALQPGMHGSGPRAAQVEEQFGWAVESLRVGRTDIARKHLAEAVTIRPLDWASSYALATLLAAAPIPDWPKAREMVDNALDGTDAAAGGLGARRRQATLLLAGRVHGQCGDPAGSAARLDEALELPGYSRRAATERLLVAAELGDPPGAIPAARRLARSDLSYLLTILDAWRLRPLRPAVDRSLIEMLPPLASGVTREANAECPDFRAALDALRGAFDAHLAFGHDLVRTSRHAAVQLARVLTSDEVPMRYASTARAKIVAGQIDASLAELTGRRAELQRSVLGEGAVGDVAALLAERRPQLNAALAAEQRRSRRLYRVNSAVVEGRLVLADRHRAARLATVVRIVAIAWGIAALVFLGGLWSKALALAALAVVVAPLLVAGGVLSLLDVLLRGPTTIAERRERELCAEIEGIDEWEASAPLVRANRSRLAEIRQVIDAAERAAPSAELTAEAHLRRCVAAKDAFAPWTPALAPDRYASLSRAESGELTRTLSGRSTAHPPRVAGGLETDGGHGPGGDRLVRVLRRHAASGRDASDTVDVSDLAVYATPAELAAFADFERWLAEDGW